MRRGRYERWQRLRLNGLKRPGNCVDIIENVHYNSRMAQTREGAIAVAAKKAGVSFQEYISLVERGQKWCTKCKAWHHKSDFGKDHTRFDGLAACCLDGRKRMRRASYVPKARPAAGRRFSIPRDGDKRQARARANYLASLGILPKPNKQPCVDCGHIWEPGERRHEFDHAKGYESDNHEVIEIVCSRCHHKRHPNSGKRRGKNHH